MKLHDSSEETLCISICSTNYNEDLKKQTGSKSLKISLSTILWIIWIKVDIGYPFEPFKTAFKMNSETWSYV